MKLAIVTVNLNNAAGLQKTIDSVVSQSVKEFEFVVIDGASSDGSQEIIDKNQSHFYYSVSEKDSGVYSAMNKGIQHTTAEYLLFLNSGDWLNNTEVVKNILPLLKGEEVISGDIEIFDQGRWHHMKSQDKITVQHFLGISLYHQATFVSRGLFKKYGLYDESFRSTGDYEFFIRTLLKNRGSYRHVSLLISNFVADGMSNDPKFYDLNMQERDRSWKKNFSGNILGEIRKYSELMQSKEVLLGKRVVNRLSFLKKK